MQTAERTTQSRQKSDYLGRTFETKDAPKHLYKLTTNNVLFFNRKQIFVVRKVVKTSEYNYLY